MSFLDEIVANKTREVESCREEVPIKKLEKSIYFAGPCVSLKHYLTRPELGAVIAEIKRRSPSKGIINQYISVRDLSVGYMQAGACALSVLTEGRYFGGANEDLIVARKNNLCPILRKDFTIDEYQIVESKSLGADVILLIAAILTPQQIRLFSQQARGLGMECILEVHSKEELQKAPLENIDIVGVNNRDLGTFEVSVKLSQELVQEIPKGILKISESGIDSPDVARHLKGLGFDGFLIGEHFMRQTKPERACARFIEELKAK